MSRATTPHEAFGDRILSSSLHGLRSPIVWGALMLVAIEATLVALFGFSYFYLWLGSEEWPPAGMAPPPVLGPGVAQGLLLASAGAAWLGVRTIARGGARGLVAGLSAGVLLVSTYLVLTVSRYAAKEVRWDEHAFASLEWTVTGYSALHVLSVLLAAGVMLVLALRGHFNSKRYAGVQALAIYWVFVAFGSLFLYGVQHLAPRILGQ